MTTGSAAKRVKQTRANQHTGNTNPLIKFTPQVKDFLIVMWVFFRFYEQTYKCMYLWRFVGHRNHPLSFFPQIKLV